MESIVKLRTINDRWPANDISVVDGLRRGINQEEVDRTVLNLFDRDVPYKEPKGIMIERSDRIRMPVSEPIEDDGFSITKSLRRELDILESQKGIARYIYGNDTPEQQNITIAPLSGGIPQNSTNELDYIDYIPVDKMGNWNEEKYNKKKRESDIVKEYYDRKRQHEQEIEDLENEHYDPEDVGRYYDNQEKLEQLRKFNIPTLEEFQEEQEDVSPYVSEEEEPVYSHKTPQRASLRDNSILKRGKMVQSYESPQVSFSLDTPQSSRMRTRFDPFAGSEESENESDYETESEPESITGKPVRCTHQYQDIKIKRDYKGLFRRLVE